MNEEPRSIITNPSITKEAKTFNSLATDSTIQGMKMAAYLDRQIAMAERTQIEKQANPEEKTEKVPTGAEIRQAREEGEYR